MIKRSIIIPFSDASSIASGSEIRMVGAMVLFGRDVFGFWSVNCVVSL